MLTTVRGPVAALVAAGVLVLAATAFAAPAVAKGGMQAQLDAPIARETPGGSTLVIGMLLSAFGADETQLLTGLPLEVTLIGEDGTSTSGLAREGAPGHYSVRLEVPASGVADIGVAVRGSSDMLIGFVGMPLVPGPITRGTAQIAPIIGAAPAPTVRAPAPAQPDNPVPVAPAANPAPAVAPAPPAGQPAVAIVLVAVLAIGAAAAATLALVRQARTAQRQRAPSRAPEG